MFTIHDQHQREILLLGVDGDDFVFRYRTRASRLGLHRTRNPGTSALRGIAWRTPLTVIVRQAGNGSLRPRERDGALWPRLHDRDRLGVAAGRTVCRSLAQSVLNVVWLAALFFPTGLWARFGWAFAATAAFSLGGLLILPAAVGLLPTPGVELLGAFAGFLAGWASRTGKF